MRAGAAYIRKLDPRLKMAVALLAGPLLWKVNPMLVSGFIVFLLCVLIPLLATYPMGAKFTRSLFFFVLFWVVIKVVLEVLSGVPFEQVALDAGVLGLRLSALLLLGLTLALSASAHSLGTAIAWAIRPFVGQERAWRVALSLSLMIHFLPMCLSTMTQVKQHVSLRCPDISFRARILLIPQALLRNLGQKTWSQTLAVAGRRLDNATAWRPVFSWSAHDSMWAVTFSVIFFLLLG